MYITGIDPGTISTGIATIEIDNNLNIIKIDTFCIHPIENIHIPKEQYVDYTARNLYIIEVIKNYISTIRPSYITIETPFFNRFRPTAFGPLSELVGMMKYIIYNNAYYINLHLLSPSEIKQTIGSESNGDKSDVVDTMKQIFELDVHLKNRWTSLTDHETDAIAISYVTLYLIRRLLWL